MESNKLMRSSVIISVIGVSWVTFELASQVACWSAFVISSIFYVGSVILKKLEDISDNQ